MLQSLSCTFAKQFICILSQKLITFGPPHCTSTDSSPSWIWLGWQGLFCIRCNDSKGAFSKGRCFSQTLSGFSGTHSSGHPICSWRATFGYSFVQICSLDGLLPGLVMAITIPNEKKQQCHDGDRNGYKLIFWPNLFQIIVVVCILQPVKNLETKWW